MSYDYHAIAVKSGAANVRRSLEAFAASRGGFTRTIDAGDFRGDPANFLLHSHGDWTVLACAYYAIEPAMAVRLSADNNADAFCVAVYEMTGFQHFSYLRAGKLLQLFTSLDDFVEMHGIDRADFASRIQPGKFRVAPGDDVAGTDFLYYAFGIFCAFVAPFDIEEYVQERWGDESAAYIDVHIPQAHEYQLGARADSLSWQSLIEPKRVPG